MVHWVPMSKSSVSVGKTYSWRKFYSLNLLEICYFSFLLDSRERKQFEQFYAIVGLLEAYKSKLNTLLFSKFSYFSWILLLDWIYKVWVYWFDGVQINVINKNHNRRRTVWMQKMNILFHMLFIFSLVFSIFPTFSIKKLRFCCNRKIM